MFYSIDDLNLKITNSFLHSGIRIFRMKTYTHFHYKTKFFFKVIRSTGILLVNNSASLIFYNDVVIQPGHLT